MPHGPPTWHGQSQLPELPSEPDGFGFENPWDPWRIPLNIRVLRQDIEKLRTEWPGLQHRLFKLECDVLHSRQFWANPHVENQGRCLGERAIDCRCSWCRLYLEQELEWAIDLARQEVLQYQNRSDRLCLLLQTELKREARANEAGDNAEETDIEALIS